MCIATVLYMYQHIMSSPAVVSNTNNSLGLTSVVTYIVVFIPHNLFLSHSDPHSVQPSMVYEDVDLQYVPSVSLLCIHYPISSVREAVVTNSILHYLSHGVYTTISVTVRVTKPLFPGFHPGVQYT